MAEVKGSSPAKPIWLVMASCPTNRIQVCRSCKEGSLFAITTISRPATSAVLCGQVLHEILRPFLDSSCDMIRCHREGVLRSYYRIVTNPVANDKGRNTLC